MKQYSNYAEAKKAARNQGGSQLPLGTYVGKVKQVRVVEEDTDKERIEILYDVAEGEHKDFFKKSYDASTDEDKKWKGKIVIWSPKDDGSKSDNWTKNTHAKWMNAFEDSNKGYTWNWNASTLKDKLFGFTMRQVGKVIEGKHIKFNDISYPCSVEDARKNPERTGNFKAFGDFNEATYEAQKQNNNAPKTDSNGFMKIPDGAEEEIPFN